MRHGLLAALVAILAFAPDQAGAQSHTFEQWLALPMTYDIGDSSVRPQLWMDLHARRAEDATVFIVRPALGVVVGPMVVLHAGYAWVPLVTQAPNAMRYEQRGWQQLILNFKPAPRLALQSRTRFEQRVPEGGGDVALRAREFVRVGWRVAGASPWQWVLWDEIFLGLNEVAWGPPQGYDQNRLFIGPGVDVPGVGGRLELGYLYNHLDRRPNQNNHVLYTQLVVAL